MRYVRASGADATSLASRLGIDPAVEAEEEIAIAPTLLGTLLVRSNAISSVTASPATIHPWPMYLPSPDGETGFHARHAAIFASTVHAPGLALGPHFIRF